MGQGSCGWKHMHGQKDRRAPGCVPLGAGPLTSQSPAGTWKDGHAQCSTPHPAPTPASRFCGSERLLRCPRTLCSAFLRESDLSPSPYSNWFFLYHRFIKSNDQISYVDVRQDAGVGPGHCGRDTRSSELGEEPQSSTLTTR